MNGVVTALSQPEHLQPDNALKLYQDSTVQSAFGSHCHQCTGECEKEKLEQWKQLVEIRERAIPHVIVLSVKRGQSNINT